MGPGIRPCYETWQKAISNRTSALTGNASSGSTANYGICDFYDSMFMVEMFKVLCEMTAHFVQCNFTVHAFHICTI